ncbi:MAG TPA: hypothetical protein VNP96_05945 [Solirubrobacterales bacterium]|nr:hypothetical protein [Solirubrobacterales bacterium]
MLEVLSTRVLTVMEAHRYAEEHARIYNRIGRNNLNEALSHLARLAESAPELSNVEQRDQLTNFEDHLRRTMMESFEVVAKARLGKLKKDGIWDRYYARAARLVDNGKLPAVASTEEIEEIEREVRFWMEEGRARKTAHRWDDWTYGAECLRTASDKADELSRKLREAVGAAEDYRRNRIGLIVGVLGTITGVVGIAIAILA